MTRVLLVGLQSEAADYSDFAVPPGMSAERIHTGIELVKSRRWSSPTRACKRPLKQTSEPRVSAVKAGETELLPDSITDFVSGPHTMA
jgi:hypothetical protein